MTAQQPPQEPGQPQQQGPQAPAHKAGFVSILGKPNAGKSTLMNRLVGEKLSIVTAKAQTTRHRIFGILSGDDFQIVYSDTPGTIKQPKYELQRNMMRFVEASLEDADAILLVIDAQDPEPDAQLQELLQPLQVPLFLVMNKTDLVSAEAVQALAQAWQAVLPAVHKTLFIQALHGQGTDEILPLLLDIMPQHPAWFPKDELSDRHERFFASEIIREKILELYHQEVPYSCEVIVEDFKERNELLYIRVNILVERTSQRAILLGHKGGAIKQLGIAARQDLQAFFGQPIYLDTHVKVEPDWRNKQHKLKYFGYEY